MLGAHEARASYLSLPTVVLPLYHLVYGYGADYFVFVVSCLVRACVLSRERGKTAPSLYIHLSCPGLRFEEKKD